MVKDDQREQNTAFAVLTYAGAPRNISLRVAQCSQQSELPVQKIDGSSISVCQFDTIDMKNNSIFEESPSKTKRDKPNPSLGFFVHVGDEDLLTINPHKLDASFKNQL